MDTATYLEIQKINERLLAIDEINAKFEFLYDAMIKFQNVLIEKKILEKEIIPKPKEEKKEETK